MTGLREDLALERAAAAELERERDAALRAREYRRAYLLRLELEAARRRVEELERAG